MISVSEPLLGAKELSNIIKCVKSGWISSKGAYVKKFEDKFAEFCNTKYAISTTNGTSALHLSLASLGVKQGDEVIIPSFTMIATAFAVMYTGAKPIFVDCDPRTWTMDSSSIEKMITRKTKAIIPVHIYGHPVEMKTISKLSKKHKLFIIEDAAEAHGAEYNNRKCGSLGDIGCFSFYSNKIITTGEGGMLVTNSKKIAQKARMLKDLSHSPNRRFLHAELAYNYRMTNMQAAIGYAQLDRIKELINKRRNSALLYNKYLCGVKEVRLPAEEDWAKNVYWMYAIVLERNAKIGRDRLMKKLLDYGIETRPFFVPMHSQPIMKKLSLVNKNTRYPVSDYISKNGLYLPTSPLLTEKNIKYISRTIKKLVSE